MTNKLLNARLGAVFSIDPAIALKNFLSTNWTVVTGYTPPSAAIIRFDTKFGNMSGENFIIIENMPLGALPQTLGASRFRYMEIKRIQIYCVGHSAKNNKWHMEKHIESLVNGNITGLQANGIDEMGISEFVEIPTGFTDNDTSLGKTGGIITSRSRATITLTYDQYQTTV